MKKNKQRAATPAIPVHDKAPIMVSEGEEYIAHTPMGREILVAKVTTYKGKEGLDIRRYYLNEEQGEWRPSPKGAWIPLEPKPLIVFFGAVNDTLARKRDNVK